ncbi:AI-2E family transporter [Novosphingobium sp. JCM 18896]|uniref:AI-2E family transporter n=1 Tax=Novosphingobium sp. JCM 18896 TaxID=2989731 RepID=UPI002221E62C|nr:AI-2E family transporter [Novosphingobium sp. JCM 18896]MCW1432237.1 AI-2E family transporter [Novosphingobium sp. JCM 18896]
MPSKAGLERGGMTVFLTLITAGLIVIVSGFLGALLWATLTAILFQPIFDRLLRRWPERESLAAGLTMLILTVAVVIPLLVIASMVVDQAAGVYQQLRSGQIDFGQYFRQVHDALPDRLRQLVNTWGFGSFERAQQRLSQALTQSVSVIARHALSIGANAAGFLLTFGVGLYVTFFLLRDGRKIGPAVVAALPLDERVSELLADRFVTVARATIKGSGLVAAAQGALGAVTFAIVGLPAALLWGVLMAIAALLPAIGPTIVWGPVALYLLATDAYWQAAVVVASGVIVIGLADNILRPLLVGRETGVPDWLVLVTTLGGIEAMGLSGIVVGPMAAALFLAGWQAMTEARAARGNPSLRPGGPEPIGQDA